MGRRIVSAVRLLTTGESAAYLGMTYRRFAHEVAHELPCYAVRSPGRSYDIHDLDEWWDQNKSFYEIFSPDDPEVQCDPMHTSSEKTADGISAHPSDCCHSRTHPGSTSGALDLSLFNKCATGETVASES